jgi:hypothetical protein
LSVVSKADIYVTDYGVYGFGISSPQLPGLVGGAATFQEIEKDLMGIAVGAGLKHGGSLVIHFQSIVLIDDDTFVVRMKNDFNVDRRLEVGREIEGALHTDPNLRGYATADSTGDFVFVAALGRDRLYPTLNSMDPTEPVTLAVKNETTGQIDCIGLLRRAPENSHALRTLQGLGLPQDATCDDMITAAKAAGDRQASDAPVHELESVLLF